MGPAESTVLTKDSLWILPPLLLLSCSSLKANVLTGDDVDQTAAAPDTQSGEFPSDRPAPPLKSLLSWPPGAGGAVQIAGSRDQQGFTPSRERAEEPAPLSPSGVPPPAPPRLQSPEPQSSATESAASRADRPRTEEGRSASPTERTELLSPPLGSPAPHTPQKDSASAESGGRRGGPGRPTGLSPSAGGEAEGLGGAENLSSGRESQAAADRDIRRSVNLNVSSANERVLLDVAMVTVTPCQTSNQSWTPPYAEDDPGESLQASFPAVLVPLYSDWNSALAAWGFAWEAHVYGLGAVFSLLGLISALGLLGLPARCPPGIPCFMTLHLFLLSFSGIQAFCLLYDAYSYQDRLPPLASQLLSELPPPCLTSAFSLAFFLLSLRSRMHLSLPLALYAPFPAFPKPLFLLSMSLLHFITSLGFVLILQVFHRLPVVILLFPRGLFVCLTVFLSCSYLIFYCLSQVNTKHVYRLNDSGESGEFPDGTHLPLCPFAKAEDWDRAAGAGLGASLCLLGCGGLQLYGILQALGLGGVDGFGFQPWPWWGFQVGCRICEVGVCLGLSLIATHPLVCQSKSSIKTPTQNRPGSWSRLSFSSPVRGLAPPSQSGSHPPILSTYDSWSHDKQGTLVVCDVVTNKQSESLPLCPMEDSPGIGLENVPKPGSNKTSLLLPTPPVRPTNSGELQLSSLESLGLVSDSTVDLRPPSPINLSRSIDQALFSESLFSHSIFGLSGVSYVSSRLSLNSPSQSTSKQLPNSGGSPLYRTSSCGAVDQDNPASKPCRHLTSDGPSPASAEQWDPRGSMCSSTQGLCSRPADTATVRSSSRANRGSNFAQSSLPRAIPHLSYHRRYRTLSSASRDGRGSTRLSGTKPLSESRQLEWDLAVQAEFVSVCRQVDALSVCSDTIEL